MAGVFKTFRALRKHTAPRWLTDGEGGLIGYALDLMRDALLQRVYLGLLARLPENGPNGETAPADALVAIGRDRRVIRGLYETDAEYAVRLKTWLVERRTAGNPYTLLRQLAAYCGPGFSFRTYDARGNCYSRDVNGTETALLSARSTGSTVPVWDWDGNPADSTGQVQWSRFWVVIYPTNIWTVTAQKWGDASPKYEANAGQWGVVMPREHIRSLQAIVSDWKPGGTRCTHIIIAFDPASFDPAAPEPDGSWGKWGKVEAGVRVPARLSTARYLNGA